jgi:hypothetical protein
MPSPSRGENVIPTIAPLAITTAAAISVARSSRPRLFPGEAEGA